MSSIALDVETSSVRTVHASFTEVEQVVLNFVINAQQALEGLPRPGRILIKLSDVGKRVTTAPAYGRPTSRSCSSRSLPRSQSARAPVSACPSATASSTPTAE